MIWIVEKAEKISRS